MDVTEVLRAAWQAVEDAKIPEDHRSLAFSKAIDLMSGNGGPTQTFPRSSVQPNHSPNGGSAAANDLARIAERLNLPLDEVGEVYYGQGEELRLTISTNSLGRGNMKAGTQKLALLVAAMRQGAGLEDTTPTDIIRQTADEFGQLDGSNFASHIADMGDNLQIIGSGRSKSVRLKRTGWEAAAELVHSLARGEA